MNLKGNLTSKGLQGSIVKSRMQGILGTNPAAIPITVDNSLSLSSTNPVQNKVITQAITGRLLSDDVKAALLQIAQKVAYIDADGQDYYDDLYDALYPPANLNSIGAVFDSGGTTIYTTDTLADLKQYLTVTAYYTDGTSDVLESTDYTLTGTLTAGTSTITVSYGGKTTTFNVTVVELAVASISAVFTQGSATIYDTDTLDTLEQYLTVTATYADSTTAVVTDYTLSGTLTEGTSTITVSYGGKTDTFSVTVTSGLDRIAYGELTYRDMFITNNEIIIGDFESTLNLSNTEVDLGDGRTYVINAGTPVQTTELYDSPTHSLKCFGTSSTQILYRNASKVFATGRWLVCISAKVDRYSAGYAGVQSAWPKDQPSKHGGNLGFQRVTNGFEQLAKIYTLDSTDATRTGARFYIGGFGSANLDCYVDDAVCTPIPSGLTESAALLLYKEYLAMRGASA